MKNLAAKLKGMNYKQALIDHGEKVVLGMIGLFVLICLAGTSWSRYDKQPEEFTKKVQQGEAAIQASAWTQEKAVEFKSSRDISQAVKMLHSPLDTSRYVYSTNWYWPMYPTGVKVSEPRWLAPMQPIADGGKFVMIENPIEQTQGPDVAVLDNPKKDDEDNEFAIRKPGNDGTGANNLGAAAETPTSVAGPTGTTAYDRMRSGVGGPGAETSGAASGPVINARGTRFIAIRSVYPLGDQLDELVKAMHEQRSKAAELIDFTDFEVERQIALPGDKPWSGKWEKVDLQATLELLDRVDFDLELVDLAYTDSVFTMPLPRRVIGNWKKYASHPLIKAMSDEQVKMQADLALRMADEAEKLAKETKGKVKGGFAKAQVDGRQLRSQFSGNQMNSMMSEMQKSYSSGTSPYPNSGGMDSPMGRGMDASTMGGFQDQMTRNNGRMSKYLLLRYFDFQVNPGNAYRYRMRVTLRNPNFRRPVEELVQEETALVEVRVTPWSEPTPPVFIPNEERIFLAKADKARIETGLPSAYVDVYQWFSEAGTTIAAKLERLQLGQFVGGRPPKLTEVFRPANYTLREEDVPVFTGSVLADIASASTGDIDLSEHADLKLDLRKLRQLGVVDKALLVDRFGQLVTLDPKASVDDVAQAEKVIENERKFIRADIKSRTDVASTASGDLDKFRKSGGAGGGYPSTGMADDPMGQMPGMGGMGNPLKKGGPKATKKATSKKPGVGTAGSNSAN